MKKYMKKKKSIAKQAMPKTSPSYVCNHSYGLTVCLNQTFFDSRVIYAQKLIAPCDHVDIILLPLGTFAV